MARLLLYVSSSAWALYRSQWGELQLQGQFAPTESQALSAQLKGRRGAPVQVVADLAGEDFHEDQIPFLRGAERKAVIERRLAQRCTGTRLATALSLGRTGDERRSERLLLASFNDAQLLLACLGVLERAGARVVSVHSTALLAPLLAARLSPSREPLFLMSANQAGLRQTFVENGRLRLSRLAPMRGDEPLTSALVRTETERMLKYLGTLRAQPKGTATGVLVVVPQAERPAIARTLGAGAGLRFTAVGLADAARRIGLRQLPRSAGSEVLYLHLAARRAPQEQFLRDEDRRGFIAWRLQRRIVGAGLAGFLGCTGYAATAWVEQSMVRERMESVRRDAAAARERLARANAGAPATPVPVEALKASAIEFQRIAARHASPEAALAHLAKALDQTPSIQLDSLAWTAEPEPGLEIHGHVNGIGRTEHRAVAGEVQRLGALLSADATWRVVAMQLPFDLSPDRVLAATAGDAPTDAARFSLRITPRAG